MTIGLAGALRLTVLLVASILAIAGAGTQVQAQSVPAFFHPGEYRILVTADGRMLHEDGRGDRLVSTRYQVNDAYSRFVIVPHVP